MSAKRSWDIQPRAKRSVRAPDPVPVRRTSAPVLRSASPRSSGVPLRARRRKARKRVLIALAVLVLVLAGLALYGLWRPAVRVEQVTATGADAAALPDIAKAALAGSYWYVIPRDSIFFFPKEAVRQAVLAAYPDIGAVSVSRAGFDAIALDAIPRVSAFSWCGISLAEPAGTCYEADAEGFVFAPVASPGADASTTATSTVNVPLAIYDPFDDASSTEPIGSTVADPEGILGALRLERAAESLGAHIVSIQMRDDEADLFTTGGTRITYVVGQESAAAALAAASFPTLDLNDGSIDYVDLRFDGKVYFKKK